MVMLGILVATVFMFLWGRWRHDMVAAGALLAAVLAGLVPGAEAFAGFGHLAVITVACVLVLNQALVNSGAVDALVKRTLPDAAGPTLTIAALTGTAAILSGFMNNVGALALLKPVALQVAVKQGLPPGRVLMPLSFGSILGGMTTMIGTPPNLIVSGFRAETGAGSFSMFDFTPVGLAVAVAGVLFVAAVGWRLVPARERSGAEGFETEAYLTEARVTEDSRVAGMSLREIDALVKENDAQVVGLVRNEFRLTAPDRSRVVREGDILIIQAEADVLGDVIAGLGLTLGEAVEHDDEAEDEESDNDKDKDAERMGTRAGRSARLRRAARGRPGMVTGTGSRRRPRRSCSPSSRCCRSPSWWGARPRTCSCATVTASTCWRCRARASAR
jgi:di/tricarboxylate transporter